MDKAKILRLCNEIENIATEIQERTMKDSYYMAQTIINRVLVIAAEISAKPKSNADRIRQMMDEELAEFLDKDASYTCQICARQDAKDSCGNYECRNAVIEWLKQEVKTDDERR